MGLENLKVKISDRLEVLAVRGRKLQVVFRGGGRNQGVACPHTVAQGIFLNIDRSPVADFFSQGKYREIEIPREIPGLLLLFPVLRALPQLHVSLVGNETLLGCVNQRGGGLISTLDPDQNIGIKEHRSGLGANPPSRH